MGFVDADGDGDMDVFASITEAIDVATVVSQVVLFENLDGLGHFGTQQDIAMASRHSFIVIVDFDLDGDDDLLYTNYNGVIFKENNNGFSANGIVLANTIGLANESTVPADIDGDGDLDLVSGFYDDVGWFENLGQNVFSTVNWIHLGDPNSGWPINVGAADFDGDGDMDIIFTDYTFELYENLDGHGNFAPVTISLGFNHAANLAVGDIDVDGDMDFFGVTNSSDEKVFWSENQNQTPVGCGAIAGFTKLGEVNGHGYYLSDASVNWNEAKTLAENAGGYLATMNDQAENDFLKSNLNNNMVFIVCYSGTTKARLPNLHLIKKRRSYCVFYRDKIDRIVEK